MGDLMRNDKKAVEARRKFGRFLVLWFAGGIALAFVYVATKNDILLIVGTILLCLSLLQPLWKTVDYLP